MPDISQVYLYTHRLAKDYLQGNCLRSLYYTFVYL